MIITVVTDVYAAPGLPSKKQNQVERAQQYFSGNAKKVDVDENASVESANLFAKVSEGVPDAVKNSLSTLRTLFHQKEIDIKKTFKELNIKDKMTVKIVFMVT
jgi:hypothetical protein